MSTSDGGKNSESEQTSESGNWCRKTSSVAYRRRHLDEVDTVDSARLNMIVPVATKRALERLARRYAVTQREMLVKLIGDAEQAATNGMPGADLRRHYGDAAAD